MNPTKVEVVLAPGVEQMVKDCSVLMFGVEAANEPVPELISQLLPLLLENALGGDVPRHVDAGVVDLEFTGQEASEESIAAAIASAAAQVETPDPRLDTLEVRDPEIAPLEDNPKPPMTLEQMEAAQVHPGAIQWARGNPLREQALRETLEGLPNTTWGWEKILPLAERTFSMKYDMGD